MRRVRIWNHRSFVIITDRFVRQRFSSAHAVVISMVKSNRSQSRMHPLLVERLEISSNNSQLMSIRFHVVKCFLVRLLFHFKLFLKFGQCCLTRVPFLPRAAAHSFLTGYVWVQILYLLKFCSVLWFFGMSVVAGFLKSPSSTSPFMTASTWTSRTTSEAGVFGSSDEDDTHVDLFVPLSVTVTHQQVNFSLGIAVSLETCVMKSIPFCGRLVLSIQLRRRSICRKRRHFCFPQVAQHGLSRTQRGSKMICGARSGSKWLFGCAESLRALFDFVACRRQCS